MRFIAIMPFLTLSACATSTKSSAPAQETATTTQACLPAPLVEAMLKNIEPMVDSMSPTKNAATSLQQDGCWKKVYRRGDYLIVLFADPSKPGTIDSVLHDSSDAAQHTQACLRQAESDIHAMNFPLAEHVLAEFQRLKAWRWSDTDMGPVFWVKCGAPSLSDYYDSLDTLVHESTHDVRQDDCLFVGGTGERACFELGKELPRRGIAAYKDFPFKDPKQLDGYKTLQHVYLEVANEGPLLLFDELNAYTATALMLTRFAEQKGQAALFDKDGKRNTVILTAFMAFTVRYLEALSASDSALSQKYFGPDSSNLALVKELLRNAEDAYADWTRALAQMGKEPKEGEEWFLGEYRKGKTQLGL
jgi:hypothetical protein